MKLLLLVGTIFAVVPATNNEELLSHYNCVLSESRKKIYGCGCELEGEAVVRRRQQPSLLLEEQAHRTPFARIESTNQKRTLKYQTVLLERHITLFDIRSKSNQRGVWGGSGYGRTRAAYYCPRLFDNTVSTILCGSMPHNFLSAGAARQEDFRSRTAKEQTVDTPALQYPDILTSGYYCWLLKGRVVYCAQLFEYPSLPCTPRVCAFH